MPEGIGATVLKLVLLSLAVGIVLAFFHINPHNILMHFGDTVREVFDLVRRGVQWAVPYVLLGATVVVPIWLIATLWHRLRR